MGRIAATERLARRFASLRLAAVGLLLGLPGQVLQAQPAATEYQVKAAFIYNFAKFVEWPSKKFAATNSPIVIGIYGANPFGGDLEDMVLGKTIDGHPLVVVPIRHVADLRRCHIVFIAANERRRLDEIRRALEGASVLTVGDMDDFIPAGGMIDLFMEDNKVRFEINAVTAQKAGLKISPRLLNLSERRSAAR